MFEQAIDHMDDVGARHFWLLLKSREKQPTINKFFAPSVGPSGTQPKSAAVEVELESEDDDDD
jgi:hypothetical protein